jgi:diguanylate cyclase (GGDEF)-like protein
VRSYDAVSRYGGEEFLVALNGCRTPMDAKRAEHMRHAIHGRPIGTASGAVAVSMSFAVTGTDDWQDLNAEQLIHEADIALYRTKAWGRNRSVLAKPSGLQEVSAVIGAEDPVSAD